MRKGREPDRQPGSRRSWPSPRLTGRNARTASPRALADDGCPGLASLATGGRDVTAMTSEERTNLVHDLTRQRDWAGLWQVALDLPVCDAVTALRPARWRWRPAAKRDRDLFNRLTKAKPAQLRRARDALNKVIVKTETVVDRGSCYPPNRPSSCYTVDVPIDGRPLARMADRPQATWTPADQATFLGTGAIRQPETVALEDLLRACLEYRFGRPRRQVAHRHPPLPDVVSGSGGAGPREEFAQDCHERGRVVYPGEVPDSRHQR